jgi:hypothetical protein
MTMRSPPTLMICLLAIAAAATGVSCSSGDGGAGPLPSTSEPPPTTGSIEIVRSLEDFEYYGACGNETVRVGRTKYFPVLPRHRDEIDEGRYPLNVDDSAPSGFMRVVPPGPGDDVGTMIVYSDGMARFESDSGRVIWLTDEKQTYNWVC